MKTIEEAAEESAKKAFGELEGLSDIDGEFYYQHTEAFKAGVEFAQRWRDPKTEKPETEELVQVKIKVSPTKRKHISYDYDHDRFNLQYQMFEIEQQCGIEVIRWRPIEYK